jgi:hypothetical protein
VKTRVLARIHFAIFANLRGFGEFRRTDICLTSRTAVRNLYLTGQDIAMLGVSGALFGGAVAASAVLGRNLVSALTKPLRACKAAA